MVVVVVAVVLYCIVFGHVTIICLFLALLQFDINTVVVVVVVFLVVVVVIVFVIVFVIVIVIVVVVVVFVVVFYCYIHFGHVTIIYPF